VGHRLQEMAQQGHDGHYTEQMRGSAGPGVLGWGKDRPVVNAMQNINQLLGVGCESHTTETHKGHPTLH